jgi:hypothetical protein
MKTIICKNCKTKTYYERESLEGLGFCSIPCAIEFIIKRLNKLEKKLKNGN